MSKVYLVGAGPGDPGLLSVKGRALVEQADAIVYDYLSNDAILTLARDDAVLVDVGKRGFSKHLTQADINDILIDLCAEAHMGTKDEESSESDKDKIIVRLKGGDPFVFGRGGEEALALSEAGVDYEVVPGVTSGIAAPAYAGIPVTHRKVASSVTFVTGHEDPTRTGSSIDWQALVRLVCAGDTLCFYMGVRNIGLICESLTAFGAAAETPVALVRWGTLPQQAVLEATLADAPEKVRQASFRAPAIIVVGNVVKLRPELSWYENKQLISRQILVTRSRKQASALSEKLCDHGAQVHEVATIEFERPDSYEAIDRSLSQIDTYDWVVFTSANGVDAFFERVRAASSVAGPRDARCLAAARVAAIGPATARRLDGSGIAADVVAREFRAEALYDAIAEVSDLAGARVLIPRAQVAREVLPNMLRSAGAHVDVAAVYKTVVPKDERADELRALLDAGIDAVTFTSSSTVKNFLELLGPDCEKLLAGTALLSIGPVTSATIERAGLRVAAQADEYTIDGLVKAAIDYFSKDATCDRTERTR